MTLIEVLLVLVVIMIAAATILPMQNKPDHSPITHCLNNVRQIDLGFLMYADDNNGKFAIQTSITNGGTMEFLERNQTFPHYQKLSSYINYIPLFVCPADKSRQARDDYRNLTDTNLSYFLNADLSTNNPGKSIMAGDRHLRADGHAVEHGTFLLKTNMALGWTPALHRGIGALGFADGHVEAVHSTNLNYIAQQQGVAQMRFSVP